MPGMNLCDECGNQWTNKDTLQFDCCPICGGSPEGVAYETEFIMVEPGTSFDELMALVEKHGKDATIGEVEKTCEGCVWKDALCSSCKDMSHWADLPF